MAANVLIKRGNRFKVPYYIVPHYIYGLYAKEEGVIRYVGRTVNPLERLQGHMCHSTNKQMRRWCNAVREAGCTVEMAILEICYSGGDREPHVAEKEWIERYRQRFGLALLNGFVTRLESAVHFSNQGPSRVLRHQKAAESLGLTICDYYRNAAELLTNRILGPPDDNDDWKPEVVVDKCDPTAMGSMVAVVSL